MKDECLYNFLYFCDLVFDEDYTWSDSLKTIKAFSELPEEAQSILISKVLMTDELERHFFILKEVRLGEKI